MAVPMSSFTSEKVDCTASAANENLMRSGDVVEEYGDEILNDDTAFL